MARLLIEAGFYYYGNYLFLTCATQPKSFVRSRFAEGFLANRDTDLSAVFVIQKKAARHVYEQAQADAGITAGDLRFLSCLAWAAHCWTESLANGLIFLKLKH